MNVDEIREKERLANPDDDYDPKKFSPTHGYRMGRINDIMSNTHFLTGLIHRTVRSVILKDDDENTEWVITFSGGASMRLGYVDQRFTILSIGEEK